MRKNHLHSRVLLLCAILLLLTGCSKEQNTTQAYPLFSSYKLISSHELDSSIESPVIKNDRVYYIRHEENANIIAYSDLAYTTEAIIATIPNDVFRSVKFALYDTDKIAVYAGGDENQALLRYDNEGKQLSNTDITDYVDSDYLVLGMECSAEGEAALIGTYEYGAVYLFNKEDTYLGQDTTLLMVDDWRQNLSGDIILYGFAYSGIPLYRVNFQNASLEPHMTERPPVNSMRRITQINTDTYFISGDDGVILYNQSDGSKKELLFWMDYGIDDNSSEQDIYVTSTGQIVLFVQTWRDDHSVVTEYVFDKGTESLSDKKVLTLGVYTVDDTITNTVLAFNLANDEYRIELKRYGAEGTWDDAVSQLNIDLATGKGPDLVNLEMIPYESYVDKGLLVDLAPYYERAGIEEETYFMNALNTYQVDDEVYAAVTGFFISTILGKTSEVGSDSSWNFEEMSAYINAHPDQIPMNTYSASMLLYSLLSADSDRYLDRESGISYFDSQEFIELLDLCKNVYDSLQNVEEDVYDRIGDGSQLLYATWGYTIEEQQTYEALYGEAITAVGFPCSSENGSLIFPNNLVPAILKSSDDIEGCWEFIQFCLSDEIQQKTESWYPVQRAAFEEKMAPYRIGYNDQTAESIVSEYKMNGKIFLIHTISDKEYDELLQFIGSVTMHINASADLYSIIYEEVVPFFNGTQTAEKTAEMIQSRVMLYLSETKRG